MKRREFLTGSALTAAVFAGSRVARALSGQAPVPQGGRLQPPPRGPITVAVAISAGVTVIDFSGPWEVFQDAVTMERGSDRGEQPFRLFTVSESLTPIRGSAGLQLIPDHTFSSAPPPHVVVVPAQSGSAALHEWLRRTSRTADVTMSVCTGAFHLAKAGLLSGLDATTHHDFTDRLASQYPDVHVKTGVRYVEGSKISTAGGLTSGIDLALRVVERYFGRPAAERTAKYMEYQSRGWIA
ncbi:MAG: DJ-1/PfpI family protein [Acidobacteriota bacterium]|nr:DJ-1/PfpI family protein [Acidobacteriota bacterium]